MGASLTWRCIPDSPDFITGSWILVKLLSMHVAEVTCEDAAVCLRFALWRFMGQEIL